MTQDEIQEAIDLTPDQERAWRRLERAYKACRHEGIELYQVLDSLHGLNGKNIARVHDEGNPQDPESLMELYYPTIKTAHAWADDTHFVELKQMSEQPLRMKCIFCGKKPEHGTIYYRIAKEPDPKRVICGPCKDTYMKQFYFMVDF